MRLGVLSYTNTASGVGCFARDIVDNLPVDSYFSVDCVKGQERWMERQVNGMPERELFTRYLDKFKPDIVVGIETMFSRCVYEVTRRRGVRTVLVVMHESYLEGKHDPDWYLCPVRAAWNRVGTANKVYFDWPTDLRPFPFSERTEARKFLHVMGYASGARAGASGFNRRQTRAVYEGFCSIQNPDISLVVHCQEDWRKEYGECHDPRVTFRLENLSKPADVYEGFDVLVQPDSYAGYNRVLLEAKACGLPVLTTDGPPMNELVTDADALIPCRAEWYDFRKQGQKWGPMCYRYLVKAEDVAAAIERSLTWDIPAKSRRARMCAEKHDWTDEKRADCIRLLEMMCH
jgi:hypothetical protein